jgi:hypothetical protein
LFKGRPSQFRPVGTRSRGVGECYITPLERILSILLSTYKMNLPSIPRITGHLSCSHRYLRTEHFALVLPGRVNSLILKVLISRIFYISLLNLLLLLILLLILCICHFLQVSSMIVGRPCFRIVDRPYSSGSTGHRTRRRCHWPCCQRFATSSNVD